MILLVPHVCRVSTITSHDVRRRYHFNLNSFYNHILLVCYAYLGKVLTTILLIEMWAMEIQLRRSERGTENPEIVVRFHVSPLYTDA